MKGIRLAAVVLSGTVILSLAVCDQGGESAQAKKHWCTFLDALGAPIPGLHVQVFGRDKNGKKSLLKEMVLDEAGGVQDANLALGSRKGHCVVWHPDYGCAVAKGGSYRSSDKPPHFCVPLVHQDSNDYDESIRGLVVDPEGKPVAGARIICRWVEASGHGRLASRNGNWAALTDQEGRFSMYLPMDWRKPGRLIPAHSKYTVMIEPPGDLGLALWSGSISNDDERIVVLSHGNHFRTFAFEDANGPIIDPEKLQKIRLKVDVYWYETWSISYAGFRDGRVLPLAKVRAAMYEQDGWPRRMREFESIVLRDDSPRHLVFREKPELAVKYTGQVIHGISGQPMPGALVGVNGWTKKRLSVRTDEQGSFDLPIQASRVVEFIAAYEQDYIAIPYYAQGNPAFVPDNNDVVELPAIRLYPAATVLFKPVTRRAKVRIKAKWGLGKVDGPDWLKHLVKAYGNARQFRASHDVERGKVNRMRIPADCDVRLVLSISRDGWRPVVTEPIRASQGEIIDLGRLRFKRLADLDLDGREVLVRVYDNWKEQRWAFETTTAAITGRTVHLDLDYPRDQAIVVISAEDQNDPNVKEAVGGAVYAAPYKKGLNFTLGKYFAKRYRVRKLVDGLGTPIIGATAKIYLKGKAGAIGLSQVVLEETNLLRVPTIAGSLADVSIVIEHPDYGRVPVMVWKHEGSGTTFVPALKPDSKDYERSIWGTVVDPKGIGVPGVSLRCLEAEPPGGGRLTGDRVYEVRTDEQGRFSMYVPLQKGKLVPLGSEYEVYVSPPRPLGLRGHRCTIRNGRERTIVLKPSAVELEARGVEPRFFHTFVFEDEDGPITEAERLKKIVIKVKGQSSSLRCEHHLWKDGYALPAGQYRAWTGCGLRRTLFGPIVVTESSPEQLVFKARYPRFGYDGRVIHGLTGEPMGGLLVICTAGRADATVLRTAEQWKTLLKLGHDITARADTLGGLGTADDFSKLTLTDERGRFRVIYEPGRDTYFSNISAVEKGYVPSRLQRPKFPDDAIAEPNDHIKLADIKLFPTAEIILFPELVNTTNRPSMRAKWRVMPEDNPDWTDILVFLHGGGQFSSNTTVSMNVPAGLNVRVEVYVEESQWNASARWSHIIIEGLNLDAGETRDLGKLRFEATLPINARVVDSGGRPVEDVTVRHVNNKFVRTYRASTNGEGMAKFSGPPYSRGKFRVLVGKEKDPQFEQSTSYEIAGPEDAERVFTLELSDELLEALFR